MSTTTSKVDSVKPYKMWYGKSPLLARHLEYCPHRGQILREPSRVHWKAVVKIVHYVRKTLGMGITYGGDGNGRIEIRAFADSNHATFPDTRRSVSLGQLCWGGA